jgi:hypothetical protein
MEVSVESRGAGQAAEMISGAAIRAIKCHMYTGGTYFPRVSSAPGVKKELDGVIEMRSAVLSNCNETIDERLLLETFLLADAWALKELKENALRYLAGTMTPENAPLR